jgi:hypothetical protein
MESASELVLSRTGKIIHFYRTVEESEDYSLNSDNKIQNKISVCK